MLKKVIVIIFFLSVAVVYLHNLTRDIYSGDIGDLVTASYVGGVAHPPGYPLFTLLGFIFSHLPLPIPAVSKVGLISVFASLAGLIIYFNFSYKVTKSTFLSLLSTSILAFSYLFWLSTELPEVFALNNFFAVVILYFAISYFESNKSNSLYLLSFFVALALTHHQTILFIFPSVLLLILNKQTFKLERKKIFIALTFFLLGISIYLYIPLAASRNPVINWDNATNLKNFIRLVTRADYGGFAPGLETGVPLPVKVIIVGYYFKSLIANYSYQIIFVFFLGVAQLFLKKKKLLVSLLLAFFLSGPGFAFYGAINATTPQSLGILERFYILSSVVFMFFIPYGFILIKNQLDKIFSKKIYSTIILAYFLIIPIFQIKYNFPKTNLANSNIGGTLAKNIFNSLPKNSVFFVSGDTTTFNLWYAYYVEGQRRDLDLINPPGVGNNIYLDKELNDYFRRKPKTSSSELISQTFDEIRKTRRMFATYEIKPMPKRTKLIPKGLVYEIIASSELPDKKQYLISVEETLKKIRPTRREKLKLSEDNFIAPEIPLIYSNSLVRIADFIDTEYNDAVLAEHYYRRALWIDDTNSQAHSGLALSLFKGNKNCEKAVEEMKQAMELYPIWKKYYIQLYYFYKNCKYDKATIDDLKAIYFAYFREDIEKQLSEQ